MTYHHIESDELDWQAHPRIASLKTKPLITSQHNPQMTLSMTRLPAGAEIPMHIHAASTENFFGLKGIAICQVGGERFEFGHGSCVSVPAGVEHGLVNESDEDLVFLAIFTPPL
jgi:quercetin dioxygenase-like cupin family protein